MSRFQIISCLLLLMIGALVPLQGQQFIQYAFTVSDASLGTTVPGVPVTIDIYQDGLGNTVSIVDTTDNFGYVSDTLVLSPITSGIFTVNAIDCNGQSIGDSVSFQAQSSVFVPIDSLVLPCSGGFICNAVFTSSISYANPYEVHFSNQSTQLPGSTYFWDFGDGTTSTQNSPSHVYAADGAYTVTLVQINPSCQDTFVSDVSVCPSADFTTQALSDFEFTFTPSNPVTSPTIVYTWDFGDGNTSNAVSPTYTYSTPGEYIVSLSRIDNSTGCVRYGSDSLGVGGAALACDASFSISIDSFEVDFTNLSTTTGPTTYSWDFGDNIGTSTLENPTYTYTSAGGYVVALTISDSAGCTDVSYGYVDLTIPFTCIADFDWVDLGNDLFQFVNLSTLDSLSDSTQYFWEFGDGTVSYDSDPQHQFTTPGPWSVKLTIWSTGQAGFCDDSVRYLVQPDTTNNTGNGTSVSGFVYADSSSVFNGWVYLIQYDSINGTLTAVDSNLINSNFYAFNNVAAGEYLIKAALDSTSPDYSSYLPTYLGDVAFWFDATEIIVGTSSVTNLDLTLIAGNNPGGPGFIGGLVSQGANKTAGEPIGSVSMLLFTEQGEAVMAGTTHNDGSFGMDNLPYGTYHVYVEMMNVYSEAYVVTLTPDQPSVDNINFEVAGNQVITSIKDELIAEQLAIFPNPVEDQLTIQMSLLRPAEVEMRLNNLMGQTVRVRELGQRQGQMNEQMNLETLPPGIYTLELFIESQREIHRIQVK